MTLIRNVIAGALFCVGFATLSACGTTSGGEQTVQTEAQIQKARDYTLGTGDRLRITVFGEDDLTGEYQVDGAGAISMPLIGQVQAIGLPTPELERRLVSMLSDGLLRNPKVSAEVINYRPYYILGEVGAPGEYPYTSGLTVMRAIAAAGGFTYRARESVIYVKHADANAEVAYRLDANTVVLPGDTLRLEERIF